MIIVNNPFGQDPMDFNDETAASRVGDRIRKIRIEKGLSQAELGAMVGLTADRIQKYENGARKPKADLLKKIAGALGVSTLALVDPTTTNYIGAMFAMFELESTFNMKIEKSGEDEKPAMRLTVDFRDHLYEYMKEWYEVYSQIQSELEVASSDEEKAEIMKSYHIWQWTFPQGMVDKTEKAMMKARIKNKIEKLQEVYDKLDGKASDENKQ
jgi:transcriptional regulator with XRE-family HTH domain